MKIHTFIFHILQKMQEYMDGEAEISLRDITKNNGVVLTGLTFVQKNINISPTIYLEEFYKEYKEGRTLEDIVEEIKKIYYESKLEKSIDMDFFTEYDKAKKNIVYKLIHYDRNKELLEKIPHRKFLDLAIVYYYLVDMKEFTNATILIHNNHMESWNKTEEDLYIQAQQNTPRLLKVNFCGMMDILKELTEEDYIYMENSPGRETDRMEIQDLLLEMQVRRDETGMYVLSNFSRLYGASAILYPGVKEACAKQFKTGFFILPSSVHELILVPDEGQVSKEKLEQMVREVNETQVDPQEHLSDFVYYYNAETRGIVRL